MIKPYYKSAKKFFKNSFAYKVDSIMELLSCVVSIFVYVSIWKALYKGPENELKNVITYFVITLGLSTIFTADYYLYRKISSGEIAYDLMKPISFNGFLLSRYIGNTLFKLISRFIPALIITVIFIGVEPPHSLLSLPLFLLSITMGFLIIYNINYFIEISTFWFHRIFFMVQIKDALLSVLSGVFFPFWFLPEKLQEVVLFTPFRYIYYSPISIYIGRITGIQIIKELLIQLFWVLLLLFINRVLWKRAINRVVIQGG